METKRDPISSPLSLSPSFRRVLDSASSSLSGWIRQRNEHDHDHHRQQHGKATTSTIVQTQARRKATGMRSWLIISESGEVITEEMEKHSIMRRTGLPAHDFRVIDPILSYPSSILGRERAIVVNLEHIKAIITANEVLVVNTNSPLIVQFVDADLQVQTVEGFLATAAEPSTSRRISNTTLTSI